MMLTDGVYLVGSGLTGFSMTGALDCNVYLVDCGSELVMVDCGSGVETELIFAEMARDGLDPQRITRLLLTHAHADHSGGCTRVRELLPGITVYGSAATANLVSSRDDRAISLDIGRMSGYYPGAYEFRYFEIDESLTDGELLVIGDRVFTVLDTPGHCTGHICFLMHNRDDKEGTALFSGDCIFCSGRVSLQAIYDCNLQDYVSTIRRLARLSIRTLLPGHSVIALRNASEHVAMAASMIHKGALPANLG